MPEDFNPLWQRGFMGLVGTIAGTVFSGCSRLLTPRIWNQVLLSTLTAAGCYLTALWTPEMGSVRQLTIGWRIWTFFLDRHGMIRWNLFGISNHIGAVATLILLVLLVFSNDLSLRRMKGARWKFWQRFNYFLFPLAVAHTLGYQVVVKRVEPMMPITVALTVLILALQYVGFSLYRSLQLRKV
jgi:hypothetical protein